MIGSTFDRLTVLSQVPNERRKWLCQCACGGSKVVRSDHLRQGLVRSCGCLASELIAKRNVDSAKHRLAGIGDPTYSSWQAMRTRCLNPNSTQWAQYGGRGIKIAARWEDFAAFLADMGPRPTGTTLDRWPNVNGHYEPGNCRWATMREQENNKRNNVTITHDGKTKTVADWSLATGIGYQTIRKRMEAGWSPSDILTVKPSAGGVTATRRSLPPPRRTPQPR